MKTVLVLTALALATAIGCSGAETSRESGRVLVTPFLVDGTRALPKAPLEEAERLADFPIVQPAQLPPDASLQPLVQLYTSPVTIDPGGRPALERVVMVQLFFSGPGIDFYLIESETSLGIGHLGTRPIMIGDVEGEVVRREGGATLAWTRRELSFLAEVSFTETLTEELFLAILDSIP